MHKITIPPALRHRRFTLLWLGLMVSVNQIFFQGGPQLGEIEAGLVAQAFGTPFAIITGGLGCLLAVLWVARRWPQLRRYNGDETAAAGI